VLELAALSTAEVSSAEAVPVRTDHDCFDYKMIRQRSAYLCEARNRCGAGAADRL
jgi:UDP-N-acetyl-D-glucosamine dehydrogenase